jgi:FMN phosphatase YigB (HAD superfamily)
MGMSAERPLAIFLDDGGVMNDNEPRGEQWRRLVAAYFAPILGGAPQAWEDANYRFTTGLFEQSAWEHRLKSAPDYESFERTYFVDWMAGMCDFVGVQCPSPERSIELGRAATAWIIPQIRASYSGAVEAIRGLHAWGYRLYTASGAASYDLAAYLEGMGVLDCFQRLYGPDLVDTFKMGPEYYTRILADARVDPADALVVDDSRHAAMWAAQAGVRCVRINSHTKQEEPSLPATIPALADLPALLAFLFGPSIEDRV